MSWDQYVCTSPMLKRDNKNEWSNHVYKSMHDVNFYVVVINSALVHLLESFTAACSSE